MERRNWLCPVCEISIPFDTLFEDVFFATILAGTSERENDIQVKEDGTWTSG